MVIVSISDRLREVDNEMIKAWTGVLRQYNLFQFLDYSYLVTDSGEEEKLEKILLSSTAEPETPVNSTNPIWQEIKELVFDEEAIAFNRLYGRP